MAGLIREYVAHRSVNNHTLFALIIATVMRWLTSVKDLKDLRAQYVALARKYHTDIKGGNKRIMQEINNERDWWLKELNASSTTPNRSVVNRPEKAVPVKVDLDDEYYSSSDFWDDDWVNGEISKQRKQGDMVYGAITLLLAIGAVIFILTLMY